MGRLTFDSRGILIKATDNSGYTDPQDNTLMNIFGISFGNGAGRQNTELNFADTTQFDSQSITNSLNQNGYTMGSLSIVEADEFFINGSKIRMKILHNSNIFLSMDMST